ncbi:MAG: hypothetical protein ACOXZU_03755 [Bacteroidales bacterium]|jgi:MFS family permease
MKKETISNWKEEIRSNLGNPEILEKLFRSNPKAFKTAFSDLSYDDDDSGIMRFWKARLDYDAGSDILKKISLKELLIVIGICLITAFLIKLPGIFPSVFSDEIFYQKNAAIIVFLGLAMYSLWANRTREKGKLIISAVTFLLPAVYINLLPSENPGDSVILTWIHLPLLMWFAWGMAFTDYDFRNRSRRMDFIRHNGDLLIIYALIAIAGGILTAITIGLFDSIGLSIGEFYAENIIIAGAASAPVVAAFITDSYPALLNRTAPLIAGIFSPLVLLTLIIFLVAMAVAGKDPYNNRDFLLIFNVMLLGVMAIIIYSVSGTQAAKPGKFNRIVLFVLSIISIAIDLVALSAIFYRLGEYGLTPNKLAVLASNILVLVNLIMIMTDLFRINFRNREFRTVESTVAKYLPVYLAWIIFVVFCFPLIFGMK